MIVLKLDSPEAVRGVHEALQQYLDNQADPDEPTPEANAVEKLVGHLDATIAQLAE